MSLTAHRQLRAAHTGYPCLGCEVRDISIADGSARPRETWQPAIPACRDFGMVFEIQEIVRVLGPTCS